MKIKNMLASASAHRSELLLLLVEASLQVPNKKSGNN